MVLTAKEELLIQTVRSLPPEEAEKVMSWASQLADLAKGLPLDWSDAWTEEDLRDVRSASLRNFEERESEPN